MKKLILFLIFSFSSVFFLGCDDSTTNNTNNNTVLPNLENSTIEFTSTGYSTENENFSSSVKITVKDDTGSPLEGYAVRLKSTDENIIIDTTDKLSDANGETVFTVTSNHTSDSTLTAIIGKGSEISEDSSENLTLYGSLSFSFEIDMVPLNSSYSSTSGLFNMRITLQDENGPIEGATVTVADASSLITITPPSSTTDSNGRFSFEIETTENGIKTLIFTLSGIIETKKLQFDFLGPHISGQIANATHYPYGAHSARVAVMALKMIDRNHIDLSNPILGEMSSESTCPCPGPAEHNMELSIIPDETYLYEDTNNKIKYGIFAIMVYEDLNANHIYDPGEYLMSSTSSDKLLFFAKPTDTSSTFEHLGWNIIDTIDPGPNFLDWDNEKDFIDTYLTRAPLFEPEMEGNIVSDSTENLRIAWGAVNIAAIPGGYTEFYPLMKNQLSILKDSSNAHILSDFPVTSTTWDGTISDVLNTLTTTELDSWKFTYNTGVAGNIEAILVVGALYEDINGSGSLDTGDNIIGIPNAEPAYSAVYIYVLNYDNFAIFYNPLDLWFHQGFGYIKTPRAITINQAVLSGGVWTITLGESIGEFSFTGSFSVVNQNDTFDSTPVSTGSFTGSDTDMKVILIDDSSCTNCASITSGDKIIFSSFMVPPEYGFGDLFITNMLD